MQFSSLFSVLVTLGLATSSPVEHRQAQYGGFLVSTFTDAVHAIEFYLSTGTSAYEYRHLNGGAPVLTSDVGTGGVRDPYVTTNTAHDVFYLIATDLDIRVPGFSWGEAVRVGSKSLVIWKSTDLVNWSEASLVRVEDDTAGHTWAPSAVYNEEEGNWSVFWSTQLYAEDDPEHLGSASTQRIRYATTSDFATFSAPQDYLAPGYSIIDQEFQYLGTPGHYARYIKDANGGNVYIEITTDGLFGTWTRPQPDSFINPDGPFEGAASFADIENPDLYHLLLDNYGEYVMHDTTDIMSGVYTVAPQGYPSNTKHGAVTLLTVEEWDTVNAAFP